MQKITKYRTDGGQEFDTPAQALCAEIMEEFCQRLMDDDASIDCRGIPCIPIDDIPDILWRYKNIITICVQRMEERSATITADSR